MITKDYLQKELATRIAGIKPGVPTTTDLAIGEMKSILVLVEGLQETPLPEDAAILKGVVWDDEFIKFDDGTFLDFRDPTLNNRPAFVLPKNGEKVKVIVVKED